MLLQRNLQDGNRQIWIIALHSNDPRMIFKYGTPLDQLPPKQTFWDRPVVASDRAQVQSCLDSPLQLDSFLAATARHSGDWLFALPIASCGLKLDDEAVRVAITSWAGLVSRTFADVARR